MEAAEDEAEGSDKASSLLYLERMIKTKSIRVSQKHGVNPTIPICFWCGKEKNEIALLGKLPGDAEAPRSTWLIGDYEPCDECRKIFEQGVHLVEAADHPVIHEKQPPWHGAYPTGKHFVLKERAIRGIFAPETAEELCRRKVGFLDQETFTNLANLIKGEK